MGIGASGTGATGADEGIKMEARRGPASVCKRGSSRRGITASAALAVSPISSW